MKHNSYVPGRKPSNKLLNFVEPIATTLVGSSTEPTSKETNQFKVGGKYLKGKVLFVVVFNCNTIHYSLGG